MTTHAGCEDPDCYTKCDCGRGGYPACKFQSCYDCYLDRNAQYISCILCGRWHSPDFDTCFKCRPEARGRDDAAAALRQLIFWRDNYICRYCGIVMGALQVDPRLVRAACGSWCQIEHRHKKDCPAPCHQSHNHLLKDDDGIRHTVMHVDHIVPCAVGGTADEWNLQLLCRVCNITKGANWWPGCEHDDARTELCRGYFIMAAHYFDPSARARFMTEVALFRKTMTWDPATHRLVAA